MILINNVNLPVDTDFSKPVFKNVKSCRLYRKSVDARHKNDVHLCCSFLLEVENEAAFLKEHKNAVVYKKKQYTWQRADIIPENPPIIVGFGPAGMLCGLTLARAGLNPIIIERGSAVEKRSNAVKDFFDGKPLNPECNVQFGEGGAGTFSDGKLTTGIKNPRCATVLEVFNQMGANESILTDAKPHIGTDVLVNVVKSIREEILSLGGKILFDTKLEKIYHKNNKICGITTTIGDFNCSHLVLAIGHSARDTYRMLLENGIEMAQKPFSVGVRIEHLQTDINKALYGDFADRLPPADYKLACHLENGRGVYTFCMCPGGEVINASSNIGGIAVNGMSNSLRDAVNSNSAILVGVEADDFGSSNVLAGCDLQEKIEQNAYNIGKGRVPITTVGNLLKGEIFEITRVKPSIKPQYVEADFYKIFPEFVVDSLKEGIKEFGGKIKGFDDSAAILTAPETRSSAPIRILRNDSLESVSLKGLYPCGEGAGYAGGIVSAAVDGMTVAEKIISQYTN